MRLVKNKRCYWEFIRALRNHSRDGFVERETITKKQQRSYMRKHNGDYYICLDEENKPIGFIGAVDGDLRLAVVPWKRRKGVARFMLKEFWSYRPGTRVKVLKDNIPSLLMFENCGFTRVGWDDKFKYYTKK